ncbi:hypothetical protein T02_11999 [Trichinella nativa]|uniref:Uncharacterized protein n=1 Tax=Trichinella nativa TaxID=6335 RepID=A0A0V1KMM3_9BILA|nr:hypothetical protein T02_11999 [Trichinella nativa]
MDRISSTSMWIFPSPSKVCPRKRKVSVAHKEGISELTPVFQSLMMNLAAGLTKVLRLRGDLDIQRVRHFSVLSDIPDSARKSQAAFRSIFIPAALSATSVRSSAKARMQIFSPWKS